MRATIFSARRELICVTHKHVFLLLPATHWHDRQITKILSSPSRKNIPLSFSPKSAA
jgi:hypothetical protein